LSRTNPAGSICASCRPIIAVLATTERLDLLIIDSYVDLDPAAAGHA
jgi:hypothetical protein